MVGTMPCSGARWDYGTADWANGHVSRTNLFELTALTTSHPTLRSLTIRHTEQCPS